MKQKNDDVLIDKICNNLYYGFNIDKDTSSLFDVGYSETERNNIRKIVSAIISEYKLLA